MAASSTPPEIAPDAADLMAKYGIERVLVPRFHYKAFRYSSLDDAVRQARRDRGIL